MHHAPTVSVHIGSVATPADHESMEEETLKMESTYQKAAIGEQSAVSKYLHAAPSFPHAYFSATELFIGRHGALSPENSTARLFSAKWFV